MVSVASVPPRLQGRFRIEAELARGGMGMVFAATDASTGRRVALKRLADGAPQQMATLFEREFYVLSSIRHPRIIDVYDYGVDAGGPYYTMELLEGSDLRELSPVEPLLACRYLRDVASSLALLHARRLVHRDISPRNVRTLPDGGCKLLDFGALAAFGTTDEVVGTPPAVPPEALGGQPLDQRADLFSLGSLAYFLLTGRHAYPARKLSELPEMWLEKPPPPSAFVSVPTELDELVQTLLSLDALARPASAAEVIDRLNSIANLPPDEDDRAAQAYFVGTALVERKRDLERLERRLSRARRGHGGAIFVDGDPGLGKTRFLAEVALQAQLGRTTVLRVDASAHSGPLGVARALLQQLLRLLPTLSSKVLAPHLAVIGSVWPEALGNGEMARSAPPPDPHAPGAGRALGALPPALEECLLEVARKNALLIAVDNIERADPQSAALFMSLSRVARNERILLVVTGPANPPEEFPAAVRAIRDIATGVRLRELSEDGTVEFVRAAFGDVPHVRRTGSRLYAATGGNPSHCMSVARSWVERGFIEYSDGAWNLPIDLPAEALRRADRVARDRLFHCSEAARRVACALAVMGTPAPFDVCIALAAGSLTSREVIAGLDELARAEIVTATPQGYRLSTEALRASVLENIDRETKSALNVRVSDVLLAIPSASPNVQMTAGLHLIQAEHATRGADLIAKVAHSVSMGDRDPGRLLARSFAALEAALAVYRKEGRSNLALLDLLVPLSLASYEVSYASALLYGDETVGRLERALGLGRSAEYDIEGLLAVLGRAPVLEEGETRTEATPDVVQLVGWLIRVVMALVAAASSAIDHEAEARFAAALRPFVLFGPTHPASAAYEYCSLILSMTVDEQGKSRKGWLDLLSRIDTFAFPREILRRLRVGALYCLGIVECQLDDETALARIAQIEEVDFSQNDATANQLRFLYYGFRGDMEAAQRYRDKVEAHAVQFGSAWQVEMWSTATMTSVYANIRDAAGNKRVLEQLERLKKGAPALDLYYQRCVAAHYLLTGAYARAVEAYQSTLATHGPKERVGWAAVRGGLAMAYNELGQFQQARELCEETIAAMGSDREYVVMNLRVHLEYYRALAGLEAFEAARAGVDDLLERHTKNQNPVTLGSIHRLGAEVAKFEGDAAAFDQHLQEMEKWFRSTRNPALIAQCDKLRNVTTAASGTWKDVRPGASTFGVTSLTFAQSVLARCEGADARKQRALELVAEQTKSPDAWLFTRGPGHEPVVVGKLGAEEPPDDLVPLVTSLFEEAPEDNDETAFVEGPSASGMQGALAPPPVDRYRILSLVVNQGKNRILVGAIAVPASRSHALVNPALLQDVATQLFQSGDVVTVRTVA